MLASKVKVCHVQDLVLVLRHPHIPQMHWGQLSLENLTVLYQHGDPLLMKPEAVHHLGTQRLTCH